MDRILEKSPDQSRSLLFGLLVNCVFSTGVKESCPLSSFRENLSMDQKYDFVMRLSENEVKDILMQHEDCFENTLPGGFKQNNSFFI